MILQYVSRQKNFGKNRMCSSALSGNGTLENGEHGGKRAKGSIGAKRENKDRQSQRTCAAQGWLCLREEGRGLSAIGKRTGRMKDNKIRLHPMRERRTNIL